MGSSRPRTSGGAGCKRRQANESVVVDGDVAAQTHRVMQSLGAILKAAGASYEHVVRTTIFLTDLEDFALVNDVYGSYFAAPAPTRATVQVAALPKGVSVEIDAIAHLA